MTTQGKTLGLAHRSHPWIGHRVTESATGRRGILRAMAPEGDPPRLVAWLRPENGGLEWTADPDGLTDPEPVTPDTHSQAARS